MRYEYTLHPQADAPGSAFAAIRTNRYKREELVALAAWGPLAGEMTAFFEECFYKGDEHIDIWKEFRRKYENVRGAEATVYTRDPFFTYYDSLGTPLGYANPDAAIKISDDGAGTVTLGPEEGAPLVTIVDLALYYMKEENFREMSVPGASLKVSEYRYGINSLDKIFNEQRWEHQVDARTGPVEPMHGPLLKIARIDEKEALLLYKAPFDSPEFFRAGRGESIEIPTHKLDENEEGEPSWPGFYHRCQVCYLA